MKQGTPEWFAARLGCVTASRVADAVAMTKSGPSERREKYLLQLVAERVTGQATQTFVTADMMRGIEDEPMARSLDPAAPKLNKPTFAAVLVESKAAALPPIVASVTP